MNPILPVAKKYLVDESASMMSLDARVDFWVAADVSEFLEFEILQSGITWLRDKWHIHPAFAARRRMNRRLELFRRAELKQFADIQSSDPSRSDANLILFN